jgi:polysaccharide deacetylase 2 family uncharacterized protein YibQ
MGRVIQIENHSSQLNHRGKSFRQRTILHNTPAEETGAIQIENHFFSTLAEERGALRPVFSTLQEHKWKKFI